MQLGGEARGDHGETPAMRKQRMVLWLLCICGGGSYSLLLSVFVLREKREQRGRKRVASGRGRAGWHIAFTLPFVHAVPVANTDAAWTPRGDRKLNRSATTVRVAIQKPESDGAIARLKLLSPPLFNSQTKQRKTK
jgi:hypothetical protein